MNVKNIGVVFLLGALLPCFVLGNPVSEEDYENVILFEEPDVVAKDKILDKVLSLVLSLGQKFENHLQPENVQNDATDAIFNKLGALIAAVDNMPIKKFLLKDEPQQDTEKLNDEDPDEPNVVEKVSIEVTDLYEDLLKSAKKFGFDSKKINSYLAKKMKASTKEIESLLLQAEKYECTESCVKKLKALVKIFNEIIDDLSLAKELNMSTKEVERLLESDKLVDVPEDAQYDSEVPEDFDDSVKALMKERFSSMKETYLTKFKSTLDSRKWNKNI